MFKKLSHILTAFLFINCSHPIFFIMSNVNDVTQKFIFHFADFIFSEHGNFLLYRNPYGFHRLHIMYTPYPRSCIFFVSRAATHSAASATGIHFPFRINSGISFSATST